MVIVSHIEDNIIKDIASFSWEEQNKAETLFFSWCETLFSNFEEYTRKDREAVLAQGYERGGNRAVCISYVD